LPTFADKGPGITRTKLSELGGNILTNGKLCMEISIRTVEKKSDKSRLKNDKEIKTKPIRQHDICFTS
jgi:hypothetical protein